jgi:hypothetical protein
MTVKIAYNQVANLYGISELFDYVTERNIGISYYIVNEKNEAIRQDGEGNSEGEKIMKINLGSDTQGSYLDNQKIENYSGENFILLSLRNSLVGRSISVFAEMIVIHELAHLIDQQDLTGILNIQETDCDLIIGGRIQEEADLTADKQGVFIDLVHNQKFGAILNCLIRRRYNHLAPQFVQIAMSRTLPEKNDDIDFYSC